jgi:hypothetical protein
VPPRSRPHAIREIVVRRRFRRDPCCPTLRMDIDGDGFSFPGRFLLIRRPASPSRPARPQPAYSRGHGYPPAMLERDCGLGSRLHRGWLGRGGPPSLQQGRLSSLAAKKIFLAFDPCNERHTMPYWGMAVYRIIPDPDGTEVFQVEVEFPSGHLQVVAGFHTEAAAQEWITNQQIQAVKPAREA